MIEIRIHGRGGQGAVLASTVLAHAAHHSGYHVQVFPEFGVERRGVPVTAFARFDRRPILLRTRVSAPDHVIVLDPAIARYLPVTDGLLTGGTVVMNSSDAGEMESLRERWRTVWVDATDIAARHGIGTATAPIVNTTMVGAFAGATGLFRREAVRRAMEEVIPSAWERNFAAAEEAWHTARIVPSPIAEALQLLLEGGGR